MKKYPRVPLPDDVKNQVLKYLANACFVSAQNRGTKSPINAFTQDSMLEVHGNFMSDGKWKWCDTLIIYVRDYDVELPRDFVEDVSLFFSSGGTVTLIEDARVLKELMKQPGITEEISKKMSEWAELRGSGQSTKEARQQYLSKVKERFVAEHPEYQLYVDIARSHTESVE